MSKTRKQYFAKLYGRIAIFILCLVMCFKPQNYDILNGMNFFKSFHIFHILWLIWMLDMILQIIPIKNNLALGSQKLFANRFKSSDKKNNRKALLKYISTVNKAAYKIFIIWSIFIAIIGSLYYFKIINKIWLFMISILFYICDLICILIWCPFRLLLKNKCCTTCRIFNWDHIMMFSPLIFIGGFFSSSLVIMAFLAWLVWEICILIYPERFCEITNNTLKCSNCTDKLCTQYCQKRRPKTA